VLPGDGTRYAIETRRSSLSVCVCVVLSHTNKCTNCISYISLKLFTLKHLMVWIFYSNTRVGTLIVATIYLQLIQN